MDRKQADAIARAVLADDPQQAIQRQMRAQAQALQRRRQPLRLAGLLLGLAAAALLSLSGQSSLAPLVLFVAAAGIGLVLGELLARRLHRG